MPPANRGKWKWVRDGQELGDYTGGRLGDREVELCSQDRRSAQRPRATRAVCTSLHRNIGVIYALCARDREIEYVSAVGVTMLQCELGEVAELYKKSRGFLPAQMDMA